MQCLQKAINADRAVDIRIDGTYGASTTSAVRDFQAAVRLPVTGNVDAATATRYRIWAGQATATPKPAPAKGCVTRVLSVYMSGADVSCLQKRINADRAADIAVTGVFDGATYGPSATSRRLSASRSPASSTRRPPRATGSGADRQSRHPRRSHRRRPAA